MLLMTTGGTIAGVPQARAGAYRSGEAEPHELLEEIGPAFPRVAFRLEPMAALGSQDIGPSTWLALRDRIRDVDRRGSADAIVITHGTDTLEETAFFLDVAASVRLPVVMTGASRPPGTPGADGPSNLRDAVRVATTPASRGRGVLVVMGEMIHPAMRVTKPATHSLAFQSRTAGPVGLITRDHLVRYYDAAPRRGRLLPSANGRIATLPRVDIHYMHAGAPSDLLAASVRAGARGLVLAGVGSGNVPAGVLRRIAMLAARRIPIIRCSRTAGGFVTRNAEIDDDRIGTIAGGSLLPQQARILLQLCLASGINDRRRLQAFTFGVL